jgi:hypothetical protein
MGAFRIFVVLVILVGLLYALWPLIKSPNLITGNVIFEPCRDSDDGMKFNVRGIVIQGCKVIEDCCKRGGVGLCKEESDYLAEGFCNNNEPDFFTHPCPFGCKNGACAAEDGSIQDPMASDPKLKEEYTPPKNCSRLLQK